MAYISMDKLLLSLRTNTSPGQGLIIPSPQFCQDQYFGESFTSNSYRSAAKRRWTIHRNHRTVGPMVYDHQKPLKPMVEWPQNHRKTIESNGLEAENQLMVMVE